MPPFFFKGSLIFSRLRFIRQRLAEIPPGVDLSMFVNGVSGYEEYGVSSSSEIDELSTEFYALLAQLFGLAHLIRDRGCSVEDVFISQD